MEHIQTIIDYITGEQVPLTGAEENRQKIERFLVEKKGYLKNDIIVDKPISFKTADYEYSSFIDLVIAADNINFMVVKCAAGSLGSREREALAAARILDVYQVPYVVVSDGLTAIILDAISGKKTGQGMDAIFSKQDALRLIKKNNPAVLPEERLFRERLIFRSYDSMNVNVIRNLKTHQAEGYQV